MPRAFFFCSYSKVFCECNANDRKEILVLIRWRDFAAVCFYVWTVGGMVRRRPLRARARSAFFSAPVSTNQQQHRLQFSRRIFADAAIVYYSIIRKNPDVYWPAIFRSFVEPAQRFVRAIRIGANARRWPPQGSVDVVVLNQKLTAYLNFNLSLIYSGKSLMKYVSSPDAFLMIIPRPRPFREKTIKLFVREFPNFSGFITLLILSV